MSEGRVEGDGRNRVPDSAADDVGIAVQGRKGLRTDIIANTVLLMGAALLFAGFLMIKLSERELLAERVNSVTAFTVTLAGASSSGERFGQVAGMVSSLRGMPADYGLEGWGAVKAGLQPESASKDPKEFALDEKQLLRSRFLREPAVKVRYPSAWPLLRPRSESYVVVTVPVFRRGDFAGALQARFSLDGVRQRVASAQKLMLFFALGYGTVLVLFGVYFLSRTVVRPIRRLQSMSQRVAAGDLEQVVAVEGPREIADLAGSFNAMIAALRQGHREREAHIQALQKANEEIRQTQGELVRSEKMASVGHLAAGMAHEIGNPLGAIVGYLEVLRGESPPGREKEIIERALGESRRIDRLVRELLDYAAPASSDRLTFDPAEALAEARRILAHQGVFDDVVLDDRLPSALPTTSMVRHRLVQVFINLLLNARDASPAGGTIRLTGGEEKDFVWLSVADSGAGMSPEVLTHIFDPFFSTKAPGKGRGLGLAVCQRVVGEAGGRIEVRSVPGRGSEFKVWLKKAEPDI